MCEHAPLHDVPVGPPRLAMFPARHWPRLPPARVVRSAGAVRRWAEDLGRAPAAGEVPAAVVRDGIRNTSA